MNRRVIGFAIITVTMITIGIWEFWGRENIAYQSVLVLKDDLPENTVVTEENFKVKKLEAPSNYALKPKDKDKLIGCETSQYVAAGTELRKEYFAQSKFIIGGDTGKKLMSLPTEWLLSFPQTLRRGDEITLYNGQVKILEAVVAHIRDSSNQEVISSDKERYDSSSTVSYIEIIAGAGELVELARLAEEGNRFALLSIQ